MITLGAFVVGLICLVSPILTVPEAEEEAEVAHLIGQPDFRDVRLRWEYLDPAAPATPAGPALVFQVHYCEMQAWGQYRCRNKILDDYTEELGAEPASPGPASPSPAPAPARRRRTFSARVTGLRMATTYSFEVRPLRRGARALPDQHSPGSKVIIVPTKGFSARATQCLPHASEVEVTTGPFFGGRIAVEARGGERCALRGDARSAQDAYTLRIEHARCGSELNDTTVATYVIVQENLPILTHSTRRFLVLCTYKPETLTVRAGINLPKADPGDVLTAGAAAGAGTGAGAGAGGEALPFDEDYNELQPARLEASREEEIETSMVGEVALIMLLVVAAFGGVALLIWKMVPPPRDDVSVGSCSSLSRNSFFRRNRDRFSDQNSVYSVTLSEKSDSFISKALEYDNTSEA